MKYLMHIVCLLAAAIITSHTSSGQSVIYAHDFDHYGFDYPYSGPPTTVNPNFSYTGWTNSSEEWGGYTNPNNSTPALGFPLNSTVNTFSFLIEAQEFSTSISSISFDSKILGQGQGSYTLNINGVFVAGGDIFVDSDPAGKGRLSTIQIHELANEIQGVKGKIIFDFVIEGRPGDFFVIDNWVVNGYVAEVGNNTPYGIGVKVNYRRVHTFGKPITALADTTSLSLGEHHFLTQYMDGLGRTLELVERRSSTAEQDKVQAIKYDVYNRQPKQFLPYAYGTDGKFRINPEAERNTYYDPLFPDEQQYYYSRQLFDDAALSRSVTTTRPGNNFAGQSLGINERVDLNVAADAVRLWQYSGWGQVPVSTTVWPAQRLLVFQTTDESGSRQRKYIDKEGKTILSKVQLATGAGDGHSGWLCTYFVYDELGRLRNVIPPKAVDSMNAFNNWTISSTVFNELCTAFDYDKKGRETAQKQPGKAEEHTLYDSRNAPVMMQDGQLAAGSRWLFSKQDGLGRTILTGRFLNTGGLTAAQLQAELDNPATANSFIQFMQSSVAENTYTTASAIPDAEIHTIQYYDNYDPLSPQFSYADAPVQGIPVGSDGAAAIRSSETTGLPTGKHSRLMDGSNVTGQWLSSVFYYDRSGRLIQQQAINARGGRDTSSMRYKFGGGLAGMLSGVQHPAPGADIGWVRIAKSIIYNDAGLPVGIYQNTNNEPYYRLTASFSYDALGRLSSESLGLSEYRQYSRNIWGGLTGINKDYYLSGTGNNYFGEIINYEQGDDVTNNLGMPSTLKWRMKGSEQVQRSYVYHYDKAGRLGSAAYTQKQGLGAWSNTVENYTADNMQYDGNGNLLSMDQWGSSPAQTAPFKMDELQYRYKNGGMSNRLEAVDDQVSLDYALGEFTEKSGTKATDYNYDENGNATSDGNKNILSIRYNLLDKPYEINFTDNRKIIFDYDAQGNLVAKKIYENNVLMRRIDYLSGLEYRNDTLSVIPHESGSIRPVTLLLPGNSTQPYYEYDFFVKDHLGNVRSVVTQTPEQNWFSPVISNGALVSFQQVTNYSPEQSGAVGFSTGTRAYLATSELAAAGIEEAIFENVAATRDDKPLSPGPGDVKSSRLHGSESGREVGPALLLRVLSGDKFQVSAGAFYSSSGADYSGSSVFEELLSQAVSTLTSGGGGIGVGEGVLTNIGTQSGNGSWATALADLTGNTPVDAQAPKAFLNYVFLDDNLKLVPAKSKIIQATTADQWSTLQGNEVTLDQSGYLLVYVNNSSGMDVHFDNLTVTHTKGRLLQESHYYPYGLSISSGQYANIRSNDKLFLGERLHRDEFGSNTGLQWSELGARQYDPQIGRWHSPDLLASMAPGWSPYRYGFCNPVVFSDASGLYEDGGYDGRDEDWTYVLRDRADYDYGVVRDGGGFSLIFADWYYTPSLSGLVDHPDDYEVGYWGGSGGSGGDGDDEKRSEKPNLVTIGVFNILNMFGNVGRNLAPPGTATARRGHRGEQPQTVEEFVEDAKMGMDMMVIMMAPIEMVATESLPISNTAQRAETSLSIIPRASRTALKLNFSISGVVKGVGLAEDVAKTFRFGRYTEVILDKPMVLSRYYDNVNAFAKGRFMTNSLSGFTSLDRMGMAIRPSWNGMTKVAHWEIPAGSIIYKGKAATQFPWLGGKTQYFVPQLGNIKRVIR